MKIKVLSLIRRQGDEFRKAESDYLKRISAWVPIELEDIRREPEREDQRKSNEKDLKKISRRLTPDAELVFLSDKGSAYDSEGLSKWLEGKLLEGKRELVFVIGGPSGLSSDQLPQRTTLISLSKLTLPHKMVRVLLLEQLYRSLAILKNHPYHK